MPRAKQELSMHCVGCEDGDKCIDLTRLLVAFGGLSKDCCHHARIEFASRACPNRNRLRIDEVGVLCHKVLVSRRELERNPLSEIQSVGAKAAEHLLRVRCPRAEREDVEQTAIASALKLLNAEGQLLAGFKINVVRRDGRPTTIAAYVKKAVARHAVEQMRDDLEITRVKTAQGDEYIDLAGSAERIDGYEDEELSGGLASRNGRYTVGLTGAIRRGLPMRAQDGRLVDGKALVGNEFEAQVEKPDEPYLRIGGMRVLAVEEQHQAFAAVVNAVPAKAPNACLATARVLKGAVELDPVLLDNNDDIVEQRAAHAAGYSNSTVWRRNHILPLIRSAAVRQPGIVSALRQLCDRLDGLDSLYAAFPDDCPPLKTRTWTTRVFHLVPRDDVRAIIQQIELSEPANGE